MCPEGLPGIECHPVETSAGWASFQAKYSHNSKQNVAEFECLKQAYTRKAAGEYKLDVIYCYSAGTAPRQVTKKQKEIEALAEQHQVRLDWRFADQILEQLRDSSDPLVLRAKREFFEDLPQPTLIIPPVSTVSEGISQYHFSQRAIPLVGREAETATLREFLFTDATFSWWGILGKGGSGKSRLLLELGHTLSDEWRWGWLTDTVVAAFDFSCWQPNKHTLLIADYVIGREEQLGNLMNALFGLERSGTLQHNVKLLLIERESGQWFKNLKTLPSIGPWAVKKLHRTDLLSLTQLERDALMDIATVIAESDHSFEIEPEALVEKALAMSPERAPLVIQLLATPEQSDNDDLTHLLREFIERERGRRWNPAEISDIDLDMLTVTTMCGGIDLETATFSSSITYEFFASFADFERYAVMIGETGGVGQLTALEPDLFGEIFVLDRLLPQNPLVNQLQRLFQLAATVNNGSAVVSFFSKCYSDYPSHPAFALLASPPDGDPHSFLIWSLIVSNVVDAPAIQQAQKLDIYRSVVSNRTADGGLVTFIEQVLFIRLLNYFAPNSQCRRYLGELEIANEVVVPPRQTASSFLDQLYPEHYCTDVIADFRSIDQEVQLTLLGPHIITVYHHELIHLLGKPGAELQHSLSVYQEIIELLNKKRHNNYMPTVIAFHHLCVNIVAALTQFGHYRNDAELCMQMAEDIKNAVGPLSITQIDTQSFIIHTTMLERLYMAMTLIVAQTRLRDYRYLLNLIGKLERLPLFNESNATSALIFVEACVQLAHGFRSQDDYNAFQSIYKRCITYAEKFPSEKIASALGKIHVQLYRNPVNYCTIADKRRFLAAAVTLAGRFPSEEVGLFQSVVGELANVYQRAMQNDEVTLANKHLDTALSLIIQAGNLEYSAHSRVWCSNLVTVSLHAHIESNLPLESAERALRILHGSPAIAFEECLHTIPSELFSRAQRAANQGETAVLERCKKCLELLSQYLSYTSSLLEALPRD